MSVLFLPPPSASAIPDASETVSGKIRIATSAEATAGTNDLTAMTPLKVKSVVDAAVVGGVTYKGTFDAAAPLDLSNAEQGDLYVIDGAGTYQGQTWAVGDHLLVNADMGGTVSPSKIDKIDSTDSVTSVAGRTGAVILSTADISGLATVASTGAYSDLTGAPTLATVATTGAYSDLSGTPTLGTAAAENVGTLAGNVVQLDGLARLPAVDGSRLTGITASVAALDDIGDVTITSAQDYDVLKYDSGTSDWVNAPQLNYIYTSTTQSLTAKPGINRVNINGGASSITLTVQIPTAVGARGVILHVINTGSVANDLLIGTDTWTIQPNEGGTWQAQGTNKAYKIADLTPTLGTAAAENVGTLAGNVVQLDGLARLPAVDGSRLTGITASVAALNDVGDVTITSAADGQFLKYDSASGDWINGDSGLYEAYTTNLTGSLTAPNQPKTLSVRVTSSASQTLTLFSASADLLGTTVSIVNINAGKWTISAASGETITGLSSAPTLSQNQSLILSLVSVGVWFVVAYEEQGLGSLADVDVTGAVATNVLKYDGTDWVDGAVAYSEVTGTPTLATVATTGVYSDLSGTPTNVSTFTNDAGYLTAITGERIGDLSDVTINTPSAGQSLVYNGTLSVFENATITATVSALNDIGDVSAASPNNGDVIAYNSTSGDWEATAQSSVTVSSPSADQTLTSPSGIEEVYIYTPSTDITVNLVAAATCVSGFKYHIKNRSANTITIDPDGSETIDGSATFALSIQESAVTLITDGSNWYIL